MFARKIEAKRIRDDAATMAYERQHEMHRSNGDEQRFRNAHYMMSFSKGLEHDQDTGLVLEKAHMDAFRNAIDNGSIDGFTYQVPVPTGAGRRLWEAPTAGLAFDLQGPDAQAVTMPPAPELGSDELAFEMAEVYELAMLRGVPFLHFDNSGNSTGQIDDAVDRLNKMDYAKSGFNGRPRKTDNNNILTRLNVFRGSSPGVERGPYISSLLYLGNDDGARGYHSEDGYISYGALRIDQRVQEAVPDRDFMQEWNDWLHVQNGYENHLTSFGQDFTGDRRFIYTPRDLATYVHFDQLFEAYLNACILLLEMRAPTDPGFAKLAGQGAHHWAGTDYSSNAGGFALYGGPHVLTLVTEVATRALKAVRYQKFNNHLRLRPEALAARFEKISEIKTTFEWAFEPLEKTYNQLHKTLTEIHNFNQKAVGSGSYLLPMAFEEGSPMHPSYGAGHAAVAGACTTILKAFFDTNAILGAISNSDIQAGFSNADPGSFDAFWHVRAMDKGDRLELKSVSADEALTLEGELNKLAANISIGRNMAGVHYFSDYYDSLRMGEKIALGILEEQALCYPDDEFVLSVPTFDGELVRIGNR